jgi:glycerophosphoryl diester phosphodiesterase
LLKPLIIGHKGANKIAPENTLAAFKKAIELNADYVEFDIHRTKDGEIVIIHDVDTEGITGIKKVIRETSLEELRTLDFGNGEKIPTLQELVDVAKNKLNLQPKIKTSGLVKDLANILIKNDLVETSIISSINITELIKLHEIAPGFKLGYLIPSQLTKFKILKRYIQKAIYNGFYAIHPYYSSVDKELVDFSHENGLKINVWTVNETEEMERLIDLGVDGIITDDIGLLTRIIEQ